MRTRGQTGEPTALLDLPFLSVTYDVPEPSLQSLLDAPTIELVKDLLASLTSKGQEFETAKAEKIKTDVELENVVRTSDAKVKAQKSAVAKHAKEVEELRKELNEANKAREELASELSKLRSNSSATSEETSILRQRIATLEASNRDALALVESKSAEKDRVANDLSEQHSKLLGLRREVGQLEEKCQSLENAASAQKFKEQSMLQEIDLLKRNNDWSNNELQTRNQEHAKFRKERNARIATLQRELEDSSANVDTLKRSETTLRKRLDELQAKADEAFTRIASIQEGFSRKEQDFRTELDSTKRLADLQAQNAATHKARLQEVQAHVDEIKDNAAEEIGRLQAEIETERSDKQQAENKVAELELTVERFEHNGIRISRPGTPMRNGNVEPSTPFRSAAIAGSPPALPGSLRKTVGGLSFTQLYANYTEIQQELEEERRRTQKLSTAMDELMTEMETRTPEIVELKADTDRLESEVLNFSRLLDETKELKDQASRDAERYKGQAEAAAHESDVLRQQLRDLSAQIKILLVEIQSRDQGLGEMSAQERFELERAARGDLDSDALDHMTSTGRLISERLVIFHSVDDLQNKNADLLRITRQLGEQMEGEEAREKARQTAEYATENEELKQTLVRYRDELNATATQISSYMKERDMFRRMLQHRGQLAPDADLQSMFGQSMGPPATPHRNGSMPPQTPRSKDVEDLNKILKEQQAFFDQYRTESSTDRRILKEQVDALAREKSSLQADVSRLQSQLTLAGERYEMLQSNFNALRNENGELQKRSRQLSENSAKQDLRIQQVAEELVEARSLADSLRNENANAKAEKELWKRIESRLTEDNKVLVDERSRLNKMVGDLQILQNERDLAESESRRRLQLRIESLETELNETKRKLEGEADDNKKTALRREYEENQNRTRIDDLVKSLGNTREELAAAKTARDQFQNRVEEMKIELRAAEEKVAVLQPRPTPRFEAPKTVNGSGAGDDEDLPAEQRLAIEVSELRRDLELTRNELEAARQQVEQYKSIAQATEEELASFNETSEQYKDETDRLMVERDVNEKQLEQRIEDLNAELTTTNAELSELRSKADDNTRALTEQKTIFDSELNRMKDDAERYSEERKLYQEDLKAQAEIAQQAQQSYEDELLKHAEAAKALQSVRKEYNDLRTEVASIRTDAEASKARLEAGEESWSEQRDRFENELQVLKERREDVDQQNRLLHQQLEAFSAELGTLRSNRVSAHANDEADVTPSTPSSGAGNLQEVIKFLRREKEIVDVQYELSVQESKRLQQQLEYTNAQLEDARQKLADERRQAAEKISNENSTSKLMQTINELNLFRESAVTLRNEARVSREKLDEKMDEITRLTAEFEPLKLRLNELEGDVEVKDGELRLLQEDRDHWRERTQNIISKYDRVDPVELEELKKQLEELKADKERLESEQVPLKEQVDGIQALVDEARDQATAQLTDRLTKFKEQAKEQNRKQNDRNRILNEELDAARAERNQLNAQIVTIQAELDQARQAVQLAESNANVLTELQNELTQTKAALEESRKPEPPNEEQEEGQIEDDGADVTDGSQNQAQVGEAESRVQENATRVTELEQEVQNLTSRTIGLESEIAALQSQLSEANSAPATQASLEASGTDAEVLEKLQQELNLAQQEVQTLRSNAAVATASQVPNENAGSTIQSDDVAVEISRLRSEMESQHALAISQMEEERDKRIEKMKANLTRQLREERERLQVSIKQELMAQHSAELQKLREEHEAAVERLKADHQAVLEGLQLNNSAKPAEAEAATIKTEQPEISESQMLDLVRNNPRMKQIVQSNIKKHVGVETEKLNKIISEKEAELAAARQETNRSQPVPDLGDLAKQLEAAKNEKDAAVKDAIVKAEMKTKVQLSQRDRLQAQIMAVKKAVQDTPEKPVAQVWEVAEKAKPTPKPTAPPAATSAPSIPATAAAATSETADTGAEGGSEEAKLKARQERFGLATASTTAPAPTSFGQPSAPASALPGSGTTSTFGLPSKPQVANDRSSSPNPNAPAFTPAHPLAATRGGAGASAARGAGASSLPRSNFGGRGGQAGGRGGQSNLPRGGGNAGRGGRGAANQGAARGGAANAGQKRGNDGTGGGDDKRQKGTTPDA